MTLLDRGPDAPGVAREDTPAPAPAPARAAPALRSDHLVERVGWSAVCVSVLTLGVTSWSASLAFPGASVAEMALVAAALVGGYLCWSSPEGPSRRLQAALLVAIAVGVGVIAGGQILGNPGYGTDSVAFGQYSARLLLHGLNPFTHSLAPALSRYHVPVIFTTHYLDGSVMTSASYPAGSFLFYLPALALGWHAQAGPVIDIGFWVLALVVMWALLPRRVSWLAALIAANSVYLAYAIGGVTDTLYLPFLLLALWRWDRFATSDSGAAGWIGPLALGVAMAVKQTPWFFFPFLLIGVAWEAHHRGDAWLRVAARYVVLCVVAFAALNVEWIVASPRAWFEGSLAPLISSFVPLGQGLINLTLVDRIGGGNLSFYTLAGAGWVVLALVLVLVRYRRFKRIWPFLVILSFFFTPRSLGNYFLMLTPAALLAAVTAGDPPGEGHLAATSVGRKFAWPAICLSGTAVLGGLAGAVAAPSPLSIRVDKVVTNGQQQLITDATVRIHNNTGRVLHPAFSLDDNGYLTNFWAPVQGPSRVSIAPHADKVVTLQAPDVASMPQAATPFQLFAYTSKPDAVSSSQVFTTSRDSLYLTPAAMDKPVPVGRSITFHVQLDSRLGWAIHRAGVQVDFGQIVYGENGLLGGTASIDGHPEGASPVGVVTDRRGAATFTVTGVQPSTTPDYFQAWIAPAAGSDQPPSGYSQMVSVRFVPSSNP